MTNLERLLAGTAVAVAVGLLVAAARADGDGGSAPAPAAATVPAPAAAGLAPGEPEPPDGMLRSQWRRLVARQAALREAAAAGVALAPEPAPDPDRDVIEAADLLATDEAAFREVVGTLGAGRDDRLARLGACNARWAKVRPAGETSRLELELSLVSAAGVGRIVAVDAAWPAELDEPLRDCYRSAYLGQEFATDHDYSYRTRWPVCSPSRNARDDGEHPELPMTTVRSL